MYAPSENMDVLDIANSRFLNNYYAGTEDYPLL
jgi:hypothetical protein